MVKSQFPESKADTIKLLGKSVSASLHYQSYQTQLGNQSPLTGQADRDSPESLPGVLPPTHSKVSRSNSIHAKHYSPRLALPLQIYTEREAYETVTHGEAGRVLNSFNLPINQPRGRHYYSYFTE